MSCEFICDGCGKRVEVNSGLLDGTYGPPFDWHFVFYVRKFKHACCQICVNKIEKKDPGAKKGMPF